MKRTILSVMMLLGLIVTPTFAAAAQPMRGDTTFTSELSGEEIDLGISGDVEFIEDQYSVNEYSSGWEEFVWFTTGWSNFELILVGGENTTEYYTDITTENMETFYDFFEIVDSDVTETEAFFVANATIEGDELVVHYQFEFDALGDTDLVLLQFSPADSFVADLETVQSEVTVSGNPLFPNVDAREIAMLVGADEMATPAADDATPVTDRTGQSADMEIDTADADATPTGIEVSANGGDWESMGLVSDTEWVSPSYDTSVNWDGGMWSFPVDYDYAIFLNEDPLYDVITLETNDGLGYVFLTVEDGSERTPIEEAEYWNSPAYAETFEAEMTVVEVSTTQNSAAVIYETVNNNDQALYVVVTAIFMDDGTVIYTQVSAAPDTIGEVYGQFVDGVEVNGTPLDLTYTVEDIVEISGI